MSPLSPILRPSPRKQPRGSCFLCCKTVERLERHHEQYEPEITVQLCHACHHARHYYPRMIPIQARERLVKVRARNYPEWSEAEIKSRAQNLHPCGRATMK